MHAIITSRQGYPIHVVRLRLYQRLRHATAWLQATTQSSKCGKAKQVCRIHPRPPLRKFMMVIYCHTVALGLGLVLALTTGRLPTPAAAQSGLFQLQPERQQRAGEHFQHGVQHARTGLLQEAIGHFKYSIGLDADYTDAYFMLGLVYYHLGLSHLRETDYAM